MADDPVAQMAKLAQLDACAVSDALDSLGLSGVADGIRCLTGLAKIYGRALTVELGRAEEVSSQPNATQPGSPRHLGTAAADATTPGTIIVVAHQGRTDSAGWGGNLSRAAKRNGAVGVICDGAVRDVDEAREVGLPLFATAATPRTARGRTVERSWGEPIEVAGVRVESGDVVVADSTGVVFVVARHLPQVVELATVIALREASMAAAIDAGAPVGADLFDIEFGRRQNRLARRTAPRRCRGAVRSGTCRVTRRSPPSSPSDSIGSGPGCAPPEPTPCCCPSGQICPG